MSTSFASLLLLSAAWIAYFVLHSLLAARSVKAAVARVAPALHARYRLLYNALALAALAPPLALQWQFSAAPLFDWPAPLHWALDAVALSAALTFVWTLRWYDGRTFLGLRTPPRNRFALSPLHRHVRHPWYFLALLVIWTRPLDPAWLVTACLFTVYLIIGSRLEDAKLVDEFGAAYADYRARVPGLLPWPGRGLSAAQAGAIEAKINGLAPQAS
jgi:methanethiol S-methyltransferase